MKVSNLHAHIAGSVGQFWLLQIPPFAPINGQNVSQIIAPGTGYWVLHKNGNMHVLWPYGSAQNIIKTENIAFMM